MAENTWADAWRRSRHQHEHKKHNADNWPTTRPLCALCAVPTNCGTKDALLIPNVGEVCESCYGVDGEMSIREFCHKFTACSEGRDWALSNCGDMHDVWRTVKPSWLLWVATQRGIVHPEALRQVAIQTIRKNMTHVTSPILRESVEAAQLYSERAINAAQLREAHLAACNELIRLVSDKPLVHHMCYAAVSASESCGSVALSGVARFMSRYYASLVYELISYSLRKCAPCFKRDSDYVDMF